jgi:hypothetical protein
MLTELVLASAALLFGPPAVLVAAGVPAQAEGIKEAYNSQHVLLSRETLYPNGKRRLLHKDCPSREFQFCEGWFANGVRQFKVGYDSCGHAGEVRLYWPNGQLAYRFNVNEAQSSGCKGDYRPGHHRARQGPKPHPLLRKDRPGALEERGTLTARQEKEGQARFAGLVGRSL